MSKRELAQAMLLWGDLHCQMLDLEKAISRAVLVHKETVVVANVRARLSKGRKTYDYEKHVKGAIPPVDPQAIALKYTHTPEPIEPKPVVDWRAIVNDYQLGLPPYTQKPPSVKVIWED
jgi:hypothetical protein